MKTTLDIQAGESSRRRATALGMARHSCERLKAVQELEHPIARFISGSSCMERRCPRECFFLHGERRFKINLCGIQPFVTEPQCGYRAVYAGLQEVHRHCMPQAVNSDPLMFQGRASVGSGHAMLVQKILHAVDTETFTFSVGKQHVFSEPVGGAGG
jgi:hypothetical protein